LKAIKSRQTRFGWDIFGWEKSGYDGDIVKKQVNYTFSLADDKKISLQVLLDQYKHENINVTLRKMSEHIKFDDLYFDIRYQDSG
jgi:gas vesicle protein